MKENNKLIATILQTIASEHGLIPKLGADYASIDYPIINQTDQSDIGLLTQLAYDQGAVAKPANGFLLFVKKGQAKSVSGVSIPAIQLSRKDVTNWPVSIMERQAYNRVIARYRDMEQAKEIEIMAGDAEPTYTIRKKFKDKMEASRAAMAKLDAFQHGKSTVSLELPGQPNMLAEAPLTLSGFREGINGNWTVESATHFLNNNGYSVSLEGNASY